MPKINWKKVEMALIYCGCSKLEIRVLKWIVKRIKKGKRRIFKRCLICKHPIWFKKRDICNNSQCIWLAMRNNFVVKWTNEILEFLKKPNGGDNEQKE